MPFHHAVHPSTAEQRAVTELVLETMADIRILPGEIRSGDPAFSGDMLCSSLLYGAPTCQLLLMECSTELAFQLTARMFDRSIPTLATDADVADTLAELVNMIGGNLKALMSPETCIGLPSVLQLRDARALVYRSRQLSKLCLSTSCGLLRLTFFDWTEESNLAADDAHLEQTSSISSLVTLQPKHHIASRR